MPHVSPLTIDQAPDDAKEPLSQIQEKYGKVLNIFGTMAYQPSLLEGTVKLNQAINQDLDPQLRELAYYTVSNMNGCEYCSHYHGEAAKQNGLTEQQLIAVPTYTNSTEFNDQQKAVIAFATQLTQTTHVDDQTIDELKKFLSDKELVTLAATVALANFTNRFNHALGVELP